MSVLTAVYSAMVLFWKDKSIPDSWRWRWLIPIPKKPEEVPQLKNLRPLMLVEALRKIWSGLVCARIVANARRYNTLNTAQHGFLRNSGTMSASQLHVNAIESSMYYGYPLE